MKRRRARATGWQRTARKESFMKNNLNLILAVLLLLVIACSCPDNKTNQTSQTYSTPVPNASNTATTQPLVSNTPAALKSSSAKSASVISENAYLRQSPNGAVLQTLPIAAKVEVIRQKGAWFYVSYGNAKGWMHGNTIRYDNQNNNLPETRSTPKPASRTSTDNKYESTTVDKTNPSGATAKCRDGTLSYSQNRRGTCSHHGGVAVWY
jgi:hypothetical protein